MSRPGHQEWVYFAKPIEHDGPIKIGCTWSLQQRLDNLQGTCPFEMEIAAALPGDRYLERQIQTLLLAHHLRKEWFAPHRDVLAVIEQINSGTFTVKNLPKPVKQIVKMIRGKLPEPAPA